VNLSANPNIRGLTEQARAYDNTLRKTASPAGVSPNVRGLTGQARAYDNTLQRTATPDGYVPPAAKRPRRKKTGEPDSSAARGPLARLNPRSWSERGEALDKISTTKAAGLEPQRRGHDSVPSRRPGHCTEKKKGNARLPRFRRL